MRIKKTTDTPAEEKSRYARRLETREYIFVVLGFLLAIAVWCVPILFLKEATTGLIIVSILLLVIALLIPLLSFLLVKRKSEKLNSMKVAEAQEFVGSHREHAEETAEEKKRLLEKIKGATNLYAVFLFLFGLILAMGHYYLRIYFPVIPALYIFAALTQLKKPKYAFEKEQNQTYLEPGDYPALYALARKAEEASGISGEIYIGLSYDRDQATSIIRIDRGYYFSIGVRLLKLWTEEELYTVFLHEFAHVASENQETNALNDYLTRIADGRSATYLQFVTAYLYAYPDALYQFEHFLYQFASSVAEEEKADRAMKAFPDAAAMAFLKIKYMEIYAWEDDYADDTPYYAPEEPEADRFRCDTEKIKKAITERAKDWNKLVQSEIQSRSSTHPTVKMRLESLGITDLPENFDYPAGDYGAECEKAEAFMDKLLHDENAKDYAANREKFYLKPQEEVETWEKEGRQVTAEGYRDIVQALAALCRFDEAASLAERAINELSDNASHYGYYFRGLYRLHHYDAGGLDDLYKAIELNGNYVEEAIDTVGAFCCFMGLQAELDTYREKVAGILQKFADEDEQAGSLGKNDKLTEEHLPEGMLEEILQYIVSVSQGQVAKVYLVRKVISDTFFSSPFIIRFKPDAPEEIRDDVMHKIFLLLDNDYDWQFSLFAYDDLEKGVVEKVPGSCVWEDKEEN